jgi:transcription-repair coupling factor (superfamily II helicase)
VNIEVLSRFKTPKQQREVIARAKAGRLDILIGTHRLLGRDVTFANLGLLVVDEEQRFGVRHKERLKRMRKQVDVLTLSATPIPRTLHLALMGARDLSIIATPPPDRLPIFTEVVGFDENTVAEAIRREMHRGGQVFFVHNRIETIDAMAALVGKLVPECSVLVAHGQMPENRLEEIMREFNAGAADVLVTTMIIESGLDMPNVNTILIDRADRFGLAQLHQLRGRVGRSRHQAYAYLMVPPGQTLSKDARARLAAIREFTDLGSGYGVAMRDLEIRGSGNILGEDQSGHIAAVGFELYCKMLEEEICELKGEGLPRLADVAVDLRVSAFLPDDYMADPEVKIRWYRELGRVVDEERLDALAAELADRFGATPDPVRRLLDLTRLRLRALEAGISEIKGLRRGVRFVFAGDRCPRPTMMERLVAGTGLPSLTFHAVQGLQITADIARDQWLAGALVVVGRVAEAVRTASE